MAYNERYSEFSFVSTIKRTKIQRAIVGLRKKLGLTQSQLAAQLGLQLPSIGRWESANRDAPSGVSLLSLHRMATEAGLDGVAKVFHAELEKANRTKASDALDELGRWSEIEAARLAIARIADGVENATTLEQAKAELAAIYPVIDGLYKTLDEARKWAWRSK